MRVASRKSPARIGRLQDFEQDHRDDLGRRDHGDAHHRVRTGDVRREGRIHAVHFREGRLPPVAPEVSGPSPSRLRSAETSRVDGRDRGIRRSAFRHEAHGAGLAHRRRDLLVFVHGEADDANAGQLGHDDPGRLDAVHFRHAHVHDDHVGPQGPGQRYRLRAVGRFADDVDRFLPLGVR